MHPGERFNASTHLFGAAVAIGCAAFTLPLAARRQDLVEVAGVAVFSLTAVIMYAVSTAFHAAQGAARQILERVDNAVIFLFTAGTCTPFALAAPRYGANVLLLIMVWMLAIRACRKALACQSPPELKNYVLLGWLAVAAALPVAARTNTEALGLLLVGALAYSGGTIFYANRMGWKHAHGFWHLCVLGGTTAHFGAVANLGG